MLQSEISKENSVPHAAFRKDYECMCAGDSSRRIHPAPFSMLTKAIAEDPEGGLGSQGDRNVSELVCYIITRFLFLFKHEDYLMSFDKWVLCSLIL